CRMLRQSFLSSCPWLVRTARKARSVCRTAGWDGTSESTTAPVTVPVNEAIKRERPHRGGRFSLFQGQDMFKHHKVELEWGGRPLTLETGKIARQADGAVLATYGETVVLATVVSAKEPKA